MRRERLRLLEKAYLASGWTARTATSPRHHVDEPAAPRHAQSRPFRSPWASRSQTHAAGQPRPQAKKRPHGKFGGPLFDVWAKRCRQRAKTLLVSLVFAAGWAGSQSIIPQSGPEDAHSARIFSLGLTNLTSISPHLRCPHPGSHLAGRSASRWGVEPPGRRGRTVRRAGVGALPACPRARNSATRLGPPVARRCPAWARAVPR